MRRPYKTSGNRSVNIKHTYPCEGGDPIVITNLNDIYQRVRVMRALYSHYHHSIGSYTKGILVNFEREMREFNCIKTDVPYELHAQLKSEHKTLQLKYEKLKEKNEK